MLVFDAPPGNERRFCRMIEEIWHTGYWVKQPGELATRIDDLLAHPEELQQLRQNSLRQGYPNATRIAAEALLRRPAE
jgi:UDP-N-acetylglucosamine:LPS N-acetylglucosamine transferase